jgi:hypothetical protein
MSLDHLDATRLRAREIHWKTALGHVGTRELA